MNQQILAAVSALALLTGAGEALAGCRIKVKIINASGKKIQIRGVDYKHKPELGYSGLKHFMSRVLRDGDSTTVKATPITVHRDYRVKVSVGYFAENKHNIQHHVGQEDDKKVKLPARKTAQDTRFHPTLKYKKSRYQKCQKKYEVTIR